MAGSKKHLSRRERKFFVLKNVILKNRKISEGTARRVFYLFTFIIIPFVLDLYFFSSFTLAKKRRKEVPRKEENQAYVCVARCANHMPFRWYPLSWCRVRSQAHAFEELKF